MVVTDTRLDLVTAGMDPITDLSPFKGVAESSLSLFKAITGGVDWENLSNALMEDVHPIMGFVFVFYIAFVLLAVLNVVTGVFVQSAIVSTQQQEEQYMLAYVRDIFEEHADDDGLLAFDTFEDLLEYPEMQAFLQSLALDKDSAQGLFMLVNTTGSGFVQYEDLIDGCMRLRGAAKAIDLVTLMKDNRRLSNSVEDKLSMLHDVLGKLSDVFARHEARQGGAKSS
eukprot:gnl/TRDRNA2_/TRDRNA2_161619_c0_seq2.p1 gnl/TRDRNA2_/TRDRNA2_161619_c0~~gnl/TRDRNA2_/TRDRNA2_161619_c0_seq2.p1  ORF type:complete len:226 (-),score=46.94 gnl/TRDRNA2_/TRDRNA2_161619_c0_seq2:172-849(-)